MGPLAFAEAGKPDVQLVSHMGRCRTQLSPLQAYQYRGRGRHQLVDPLASAALR